MTKTTGIFVNPGAAASASAAKFGIDGLFSRALPSYIIIYIYTHKHGHPMQAALCVYAKPKRREEKTSRDRQWLLFNLRFCPRDALIWRRISIFFSSLSFDSF